MNPAARRASVANNAISIFTGQVFTWALSALTLMLIPRYLGAEGAGIVYIGGVYTTLAVTFGGLGMTTLVIREVARDPENTRTWMGTVVWLNVLFGIATAAVALVVAWILGYRTIIMVSVALQVVAVPALLITALCIAILQGMEIMRYAAIFDVAAKAALLMAAVLVVALDLGIVPLISMFTFTAFAVAIAQLYLVRDKFRFRLRRFSKSAAIWVTRACLPFFVITVFWALYTSTDVVLLSVLATEVDAAIYHAPTRIFGSLLFFTVTIGTVMYPRFAAIHRDSPERLPSIADASLRIATTGSIMLMFATFAASGGVVVFIFGEEFRASGPVLMAFAVSLVPTGISIVAGRLAWATDRQKEMSYIGIGAFFLNVVLCFILIPIFDARYGNAALGAASGLVAVEAVMVLAMSRFLPAGTFSAASMTFYAKSLAGVAAGLALFAFLVPALGTFAAGAAGGIGFLIVILATRAYTPTELRRLVQAAARHRGGPVEAPAS